MKIDENYQCVEQCFVNNHAHSIHTQWYFFVSLSPFCSITAMIGTYLYKKYFPVTFPKSIFAIKVHKINTLIDSFSKVYVQFPVELR